jgi:hypothetical protein
MEEYIQRFGLAEDYKATSEIFNSVPLHLLLALRCQNKTFFNGNDSDIPVQRYHAYTIRKVDRSSVCCSYGITI